MCQKFQSFLALDIFEFEKGSVPKHNEQKNDVMLIFSKMLSYLHPCMGTGHIYTIRSLVHAFRFGKAG
jgi:hypothetical protein